MCRFKNLQCRVNSYSFFSLIIYPNAILEIPKKIAPANSMKPVFLDVSMTIKNKKTASETVNIAHRVIILWDRAEFLKLSLRFNRAFVTISFFVNLE